MIVDRNGVYFYVVMVAPRCLLLLQLVEVVGGELRVEFDIDLFSYTAPESIEQYACWEHNMEFDVSGDHSEVRFVVRERAETFWHMLPNITLQGSVALR